MGLDDDLVGALAARTKEQRPHRAHRGASGVLRLVGVKEDGAPTRAGMTTFSSYPQEAYPNLRITATAGDADVRITEADVIAFRDVPRSRDEAASHLGVSKAPVAREYLNSLVEQRRLFLTLPNKPRSKRQGFVSTAHV